jgi:hypothetical protein
MARYWVLSLIVVLFISACTGSATPPPAPAVPTATIVEPTKAVAAPTSAPSSPSGPTATSTAPTVKPVKTWEDANGFRKSEVKYLGATGRPQFVEFFAFW